MKNEESVEAQTIAAQPTPREKVKEIIEEKKTNPLEPVKRRGRKSKVQQQEEQQKVLEQFKTLMGFLATGLDIVCKRLPNPKPLQPIEREMFIESGGMMAEKYAPAILDWQAEIAFGVTMGFIIIPRLQKDKSTSPIRYEPTLIKDNGNQESNPSVGQDRLRENDPIKTD